MKVLDKIDKLYSSFKSLNKFSSLFRFLIRETTNVIIPVLFKVRKSKETLNPQNNLIVSFTTFPDRISKIWLVIECMLRQKHLPSKIILWLSTEQFPNQFSDLPNNLLSYYKKKLVEIRFVNDDLRSHKKYFYVLQEFPDDLIVTVDDDLFYSSNTLNDLYLLHKKFPDCLCCLRAYKVKKVDDKIAPYKTWKILYNGYGPSFELFHTSGGGTLYKKSFFPEEVFDIGTFKKLSFKADDVWLNLMLQLKGTKSVKANFYSHLLPILNNSEKLSANNVYEGGNDQQISAIVKYFQLDESKIFSS